MKKKSNLFLFVLTETNSEVLLNRMNTSEFREFKSQSGEFVILFMCYHLKSIVAFDPLVSFFIGFTLHPKVQHNAKYDITKKK